MAKSKKFKKYASVNEVKALLAENKIPFRDVTDVPGGHFSAIIAPAHEAKCNSLFSKTNVSVIVSPTAPV